MNNPLKYTDPSGWTAFATWDDFYNEVNYLWNNGGGNWNSTSGRSSVGNEAGIMQAIGNSLDGSGGWGNTNYPNGATVVEHSYLNGKKTYTSHSTGWVCPTHDAVWYSYEGNTTVPDKDKSIGPDWKFYTSIVGVYAEKAYYSEKYGTWMGRNFKLYNATWGGNGFTGGKNSFGKTTSNKIKWTGRAFGAWNAYSINEQRRDGEIDNSQWFLEQSSNAFSTLGGIYGGAWSIGWELGRIITNIEGYQEFKFNFWYDQFEKDFGRPSHLNEEQWLNFYLNYNKQ
jgi:hypothetical protein